MAASNSVGGLDASYPADPSQVASIRRAVSDVASRCDVGMDTQNRIALAVSEAATNAVLHAYRVSGTPGEIRVTATPVRGSFLDVVIADRGVGMSERLDSPGMGVGLAVMAHEADRLEVREGVDGGTEVFLRFALAARSFTS